MLIKMIKLCDNELEVQFNNLYSLGAFINIKKGFVHVKAARNNINKHCNFMYLKQHQEFLAN